MAKKRNAQDGWMALHQAHGKRLKALQDENKALKTALRVATKAWSAVLSRVEKLEGAAAAKVKSAFKTSKG